MKFREKVNAINHLDYDIAVISECESFEKYSFNEYNNKIWIGENPSKGIGVFSKSKYQLSLHENYNSQFKYIVPIRVTGNLEFILFAIWVKIDTSKYKICAQQLYDAFKFYSDLLNEPCILTGDFNSNSIWDNLVRERNFTDVTEQLSSRKILSSYHTYFKENFGRESQYTQYMYHHLDKPYHLDYLFASEKLLGKVSKVEIGEFNRWKALSDHMPLEVEFNF